MSAERLGSGEEHRLDDEMASSIVLV